MYSDTGRPAQAEEAYNETLGYYRQLAEQSPATYLPNVATTLNNLGILYSDTGRPAQAEEAYNEALTIRLTLARKEPDSYAVSVAETAVNFSLFFLNLEPEPNKEGSIELALIAISWVLPYVDRLPYALKIAQTAVGICSHWGIDWQAELQKQQDGDKGDEG